MKRSPSPAPGKAKKVPAISAKAQPAAAKSKRQLFMDLAVAATTILLVVGGVWFQVSSNKVETTCKDPGAVHQLSVASDAFSQDRLIIARCDTVRIANAGAETYDLAFGEHDSHVAYPGFSRQLLQPGEYFELNALQAGSYTMHDHLRDQAKVDFDIRLQ